MENKAAEESELVTTNHIDMMLNTEFSAQDSVSSLSSELFPDYVEVMGLGFDPFAQPSSARGDLYLGAGRRELIDQVIYLSEFNAGALVVSGDCGIGKSSLFAGLPSEFDESWSSCSISAGDSPSSNQFFFQLASALGAQVSDAANSGELLAAIRHQLTQEFSEPFILLIDDAHLLEDSVLSALLSLLQLPSGNEALPVHVVLFGDDQLIVRLDNFSMVDVLLHDIALSSFSKEESAEYLLQKMRSSGWVQALPFSDDELNLLHRASGGIPGELNEQVRQLLLSRVTIDRERLDPGAGLPVAHMFSVVALLGVLVMAYFYKDSWFDGEDSQVDIIAAPVDQSTTSPSVNLPTIAPLVDKSAVRDSFAHDTASDVITTPQTESLDVVGVTDDLDEPSTARPNENVELELSSITEPVSMSSEITASMPSLADLPPSAALGAPEAVVKQPQFDQLLSSDERLLLSFKEDRFVLQVMAAGSRIAVERFMASQSNHSELHMYTTWRQGKPWHVVVAGNYSTSSEARRGVNTLPKTQKKAGPWPRSVTEIQAKIKEFRRI